MKKILIICMIMILAFCMCSCDSEQVKKAKADFEEENYSEVIKDLSKEKIEDEDVKDMLAISKAKVFIEKGQYINAARQYASTEEGKESEDFKDTYKTAMDKAIKNHNAKKIFRLFKIDGSKARKDYVFKQVTKACKNFDYESFVLVDKLIKGSKKSEFKKKLKTFRRNNVKRRTKAFLLGKWEWKEKAKKHTRVKVVRYQNNFVGRISQVGTRLEEFQYKKNDLYWSKFEILDKHNVLCYHLVKTEDGSPVSETATMKLNYKKKTINIHLTGSPGYNLITPERTWKKLD